MAVRTRIGWSLGEIILQQSSVQKQVVDSLLAQISVGIPSAKIIDLEASKITAGTITIQDISLEGSAETAVKAQGTLTMDTQPSDGDTYTVDAKTYTFQTVLTDVDGNVNIGGTLAQAKLNLVAAFDLSGTPGTDYALSMTAHPTVDIAAFVTDDAVLTAKTAGGAGNAIATTETFTASTNVFDDIDLGKTTAGSTGAIILETTFTQAVIRSDNFQDGLSGFRIRSDGDVQFNNLLLRGDLESGNWDGASPADLEFGIDTAATEGYYLDSSVGTAQFTGDMFIGGPGGDYLFLDASEFSTITGIKWFRNSIEVARIFASDTNFFIQSIVSGGGDIELRPKVGDTSYGVEISGGLEISAGFIATLRGSATVPAYHFGGASDNDTGMFSPGANQVSLVAGGSTQLTVSTTTIDILDTLDLNDFDIDNVNEIHVDPGTAGSPGYNFEGDENTGMYRIGADRLGFSGGGQLGFEVAEGSDPVDIRTDSQMKNVTAGISNSGGSGFRLLRVPN